MGAYETDQYEWIQKEKELIKHCTDRGTPVLGLCLGCQLAAAALGGSAYPSKVFEVGYVDMYATEDGIHDEVLGVFFDESKKATQTLSRINEQTEKLSQHVSDTTYRYPSKSNELPLLMHHGDTY